MDSQKYSPLRDAHRRIATEMMHKASQEVTDRRQRETDREGGRESIDRTAPRAAVEATARAANKSTGRPAADKASGEDPAASRPAGNDLRMLVVSGPAPNESAAHFQWRLLTTARLERERAKETGRETKAGATRDALGHEELQEGSKKTEEKAAKEPEPER